MQSIALAIQEGASAYLNRQYQVITLVGIVVTAFLTYVLGWHVGVGFVIGAFLSGLAGYIGMNVSVRANVNRRSCPRRTSVSFECFIYSRSYYRLLLSA